MFKMVKEKTKKRITRSKAIKRFLPLVLLLSVLTLIALFWANVSWIASGNVWRQILSDAFPRFFPRSYVMAVKSPVLISGTPEIDVRSEIRSGGQTAPRQSEQKPRRDMLTIPKINITAPIITAQTDDNEVITGLLDSGVVLYPGSAMFGNDGQTVILGHSAPAGWPKIKYDWVFSKINELEEGDMVVVTYNYITRYYKVAGSKVVDPKTGMPASTVSGNSLMLISCWPPGKDAKRIAVEAGLYGK